MKKHLINTKRGSAILTLIGAGSILLLYAVIFIINWYDDPGFGDENWEEYAYPALLSLIPVAIGFFGGLIKSLLWPGSVAGALIAGLIAYLITGLVVIIFSGYVGIYGLAAFWIFLPHLFTGSMLARTITFPAPKKEEEGQNPVSPKTKFRPLVSPYIKLENADPGLKSKKHLRSAHTFIKAYPAANKTVF